MTNEDSFYNALAIIVAGLWINRYNHFQVQWLR